MSADERNPDRAAFHELTAAVPSLPRDEGGPVFHEPWEAQAFAMTLALYRRGLFTWPEWAAALSEEIRRALHISEGDEVEFSVHDDGTITVRGYVSIPTDQAWFFTPEWLAGEREADEEIAAGRGTAHESAEDMFAHLDGLGAADA